MSSPDSELIVRMAALDQDAFASFYDRYAARTFGLLLRLLRNRTDAEDVLQETFLQVWRQAERFDRARSAPDVWVLLIARSRAVDLLRRRKVTTNQLPDSPAAADPGEGHREEAGRVLSVMANLPPEQQTPLYLAFFQGMTHQQIAQHLAIPLGTVKTRIRLGMKYLRDRIAGVLVEGAA